VSDWIISTDTRIDKSSQYQIECNFVLVEVALIRADKGQTDGRDEGVGTYRDYVKKPKNNKIKQEELCTVPTP
jgi:hypothetical protein